MQFFKGFLSIISLYLYDISLGFAADSYILYVENNVTAEYLLAKPELVLFYGLPNRSSIDLLLARKIPFAVNPREFLRISEVPLLSYKGELFTLKNSYGSNISPVALNRELRLAPEAEQLKILENAKKRLIARLQRKECSICKDNELKRIK